MARIPDAFIDDLLARTDIVEVVGARVPLKRKGREYSAPCPFHDERTPSFYVSPVKQFYHCFGCGAHGTAISFLMNYDRLEFLDAVEELARAANMEIPRDERARTPDDDTRGVYDALEAAARHYRNALAASPATQAYLDGRGVDMEIRELFGIGYAPEGFSALKDALGTDERRLKLLERAGLLSKNDRGHTYDKFRDRVMFPIADRRGRTIAFGGRVLKSDDGPKYLNSPETALFHKGRELYGLWQVRQAQQKIARLIVVEGYMDVVALFQHGLREAVATLGTATTADHAELLFRNAPDVYFCFDGDAAGRRAASKAMESVLPRMRDGRQAFFLFLPEGEDPDSIVRSEGTEGFEARLRDAVPLSQFFFDQFSEGVNLGTLDGKARLAERTQPLLAQIPDGAFADLMRQHLTTLTGVGARNEAAPAQAPTRRMRTGRGVPAPKRSLVRTAITLLLQRPALALDTPDQAQLAGLRQPGVPLLVELIDLVHARPDISTGMLLQHFEGRDEAASLHKLATSEIPGDAESWRQDFAGAVAQLVKQTKQQRVDDLMLKWREGGSPSALNAEEHSELRELQQAIRN
ncbi:DNA primase [Luteimonas yindakuii]|uniref:DNA primase n=1 Tax=Luteimonas yindakuii TaxID=2565782 RepID=A0A4Z1RHI8_9GAMM|nr:DNA primase [Luteimonas yindakuii]TKS53101.1 DNA primase [Luteimonas yindakuii]